MPKGKGGGGAKGGAKGGKGKLYLGLKIYYLFFCQLFLSKWAFACMEIYPRDE